jgi:hypothetical protein
MEVEPRYDVALSFLASDEPTGRKLYEGLEGLKVFFFPRHQEETAGTDGLETMRKPFLLCRVMVVLYRQGWGETPWTGVEAHAIKDRCLRSQFRDLMFVQLEKSLCPNWLPQTHVQFNIFDFGMAQLVGAVKARVLDSGGHIARLDPISRGIRAKAEADYQADRLRLMHDSQWIKGNVQPAISSLIQGVKEKAEELNEKAGYTIAAPTWRNMICALRHGPISILIEWRQPIINSLFDELGYECELKVIEYSGAMTIPGENRLAMVQPREVVAHTFKPDVSRSREFVLKATGSNEFVALGEMPDRIFEIFYRLVERAAAGEIKPRSIFEPE